MSKENTSQSQTLILPAVYFFDKRLRLFQRFVPVHRKYRIVLFGSILRTVAGDNNLIRRPGLILEPHDSVGNYLFLFMISDNNSNASYPLPSFRYEWSKFRNAPNILF